MEVEELAGQRMVLNMGPQHPSTHGVLRLVVELEGERVVSATPVLGYLHRGFEKLCENRTYVQVIPLTDRLDYLSSMGNNMVYVKAVEELAGIQVPERAEYIRVIALELQRLASHLLATGTFGQDLGAISPLFYTFREREVILDLLEMLSGARLTYNYMRFGGVRGDLPNGFVERTREALRYLEPKIDEYEAYLSDNEIFCMRTKGIGILTPEDGINMGATGPMLRASGVKTDLRKDDPYTIYDRFDFNVITRKDGDCFARYEVRLDEMRESIKILEQALSNIPPGEVVVKPKNVKPPAGEVYSRIESPRGELGMYVVSDGTGNPYRLKIRSPAYSNLSCLPYIVKGIMVADLVAILGSVDIVLGEIDR
ncbi:MAG: NADH-quinone oxidoreductase subunit D [Candidatus Hydrothermarchaeota archaeon]